MKEFEVGDKVSITGYHPGWNGPGTIFMDKGGNGEYIVALDREHPNFIAQCGSFDPKYLTRRN